MNEKIEESARELIEDIRAQEAASEYAKWRRLKKLDIATEILNGHSLNSRILFIDLIVDIDWCLATAEELLRAWECERVQCKKIEEPGLQWLLPHEHTPTQGNGLYPVIWNRKEDGLGSCMWRDGHWNTGYMGGGIWYFLDTKGPPEIFKQKKTYE